MGESRENSSLDKSTVRRLEKFLGWMREDNLKMNVGFFNVLSYYGKIKKWDPEGEFQSGLDKEMRLFFKRTQKITQLSEKLMKDINEEL